MKKKGSSQPVGHRAAHSGSHSAQQEDFTTGRRVYSEGIAARLCQDLRPRSTLTADASGPESCDELFSAKKTKPHQVNSLSSGPVVGGVEFTASAGLGRVAAQIAKKRSLIAEPRVSFTRAISPAGSRRFGERSLSPFHASDIVSRINF